METVDSAPSSSEHFDDWLAEVRRMGGEFAWIRRNNLAELHNFGRTADQLRAAVLSSRRIRDTVRLMSAQRGQPESVLRANAEQILSTMAHDVHLRSAVQPIGYSLAKIFGSIFSNIWINSAQMAKIREMAKDRTVPIVWMPTHRSYIDFLLLSMLSYHHNVQIPAICAADDFRASRLLGEALRRCGAFFIRRSFKEDVLYWALFSEYIQQHLLHGDRPLEFFIEGQRSRTGKSVYPRTGLLRVVLEPFLRAQLYDTILVPISIDYDRILEEVLYANELIGFSKPRETTSGNFPSGLLRARSVLADNFGAIRMTIGQPISVRQCLLGNNCGEAIDVRLRMTDDTNSTEWDQTVQKLAEHIVQQQNSQRTLTIWPFISLIILQQSSADDVFSSFTSYNSPEHHRLINISSLVHHLNAHLKLFKKCQIVQQIWYQNDGNIEAEIRDFVSLHHSFLALSADNFLRFVPIPPPSDDFQPFLLNFIILQMHSNPIIHCFAPFCFLAIVRLQNGSEKQNLTSEQKEAFLGEYCFLRRLFYREFVFDSSKLSNEFNSISSQMDKNLDISTDYPILAEMVKPFFLAYHCIVCLLIAFSNSINSHSLAELTKRIHREILNLVQRQNFFHQRIPPQIASTDLVKNALNAMRKSQIIKLNADNNKLCSVDFVGLNKLRKRMEQLIIGAGWELGPEMRGKAKI